MKSINSRLYLDFNATSPLANSVIEFLAKGDFLFANPSSLHTSGKLVRRELNLIEKELFDLFHLPEESFHLIFHSGATEGMNSIIKGFFLARPKELKHFFYAGTDHNAITQEISFLESIGVRTHVLPVKFNGDFDDAKWIQIINDCEGEKLLNYTWVHNESGVVWDLARVETIAERTQTFVHVDAVQSVGKVLDWKELSPKLHSYTWSAHKFGALKGTGFSFLKKNIRYESLLSGGMQQRGLRPGTENYLGAKLILLALQETSQRSNVHTATAGKTFIENQLVSTFGKRLYILGDGIKRNSNTIGFAIEGVRADSMLMTLDLGGVDISTVSACSSATVAPSRVMLAMGFSEDLAKGSIRLSFSTHFSLEEAHAVWQTISPLLTKF